MVFRVGGSRSGSALALGLVLALTACGNGETQPAPAAATWTLAGDHLDSALISVWGSGTADVWAVGADSGAGPLVLHWDGAAWNQLDTGTQGDLWWVFGFAGGPVFMGGSGGRVLSYDGGAFSTLATPGEGTVFGLWGTAPDDMWAVGGAEGGADGAFAWRLDGDHWVSAPGFPDALSQSAAIWKAWGSATDDVWLVGTAGNALHWDGASFTRENLGGGESLFTVHYDGGRYVAVGGSAAGLVFENDGSGWARVDDGTLPALVGVHMTSAERGYAVGRFGGFVERKQGSWVTADGPATNQTLHAIWADESGGLWAVGGALDQRPRVDGVIAYRGTHPPARLP